MYKLFINHVQVGNYETADELNRSIRNVFTYGGVIGMKLADEGGAISIMLTSKD